MHIPSEEERRFVDAIAGTFLNSFAMGGNKTAIVLKKSLELQEKDTKIGSYFIDNYKKTSEENLDLAIDLYTQMNQLFDDFIKKLNIEKGEKK